MDYKDKNVIRKRYNDAAYEIAKTEMAIQKGQPDEAVRHSRNAGEAISQTLEYAMKHHLSASLKAVEQKYFNVSRVDIHELIGRYIDKEGNDNGQLYKTVNDLVDPTVDFVFLRDNKKVLTNEAKHKGSRPDFEIQKKYFLELGKFVTQYVDENLALKSVSDYQMVDFQNWDTFYLSCDKFTKEERNYILITGRASEAESNALKELGIPPWDLVIDFDYQSLENGLYSKAFSDRDIEPRKIKVSDPIEGRMFSKFSQSHYHYFINNFKGSGQPEVKEYRAWFRLYEKPIDSFLMNFASQLPAQKTIVVVMYNSRQHVALLIDKIYKYFGDNVVFVFVGSNLSDLGQTIEDANGVKVEISISDIAEGIVNFSSNFGITNPHLNQYLIPFLENSESKDVTGQLTAEQFFQLEDDFEVLHKALPQASDTDEDKREFLCGKNKISWFGIKYRFDVERQNFVKKYVKPIERLIENGRGKVNLIHEAGYGGSTIARRIAWEIHDSYPTLILKKYRDKETLSKIVQLHQLTRKTLFIVMEVPQAISSDEVESLYKLLPSSRPVVFLVVKRGRPIPPSRDLYVNDWGNDAADLVRAYKPYLSEYNNPKTEEDKAKELDEIINSTDNYKKTPFYIGLVTFEEKFIAIKDFIKKFVEEVRGKEEQKRVLLYLSICDSYLGQGLPASFFRTVFKEGGKNSIINLEKYFSEDSSIVSSLIISFTEGNQKVWKIRHPFLSKELKEQLLRGESVNPEIWKQNLADYCIKLIEDSVSESLTADYTEELFQKLFIGSRRDRAGEAFTDIIRDITATEDKERLFKTLKETFPDNPHYCSHLARFYAYYDKNRELALKYADEAIRLSEAMDIQDSLLHHIKGMCIRSTIFDLMDKNTKSKSREGTYNPDEYEEILDKLIPSAAKEFETSRQIARKQNKADEHGYVAHIQMLIRAIDFGAQIADKSKGDFLAEIKEPFIDWLDLAESLLEEIRRIHITDDDSSKVEECSNQLLELYDNYNQILQNLRSQLDKSRNPGRIRRQIVRIYFKREIQISDNKVLNDLLSLMEQNINSEPDNERNFYLWFRAARLSRISLEDALSRVGKWKINSITTDSVFYFYVLKVFRALEGYTNDTIDAFNLIKECKAKGRGNTTILEWYGKGNDLQRLVHRNSLKSEEKDGKLELVRGYFTEFRHDGSGLIVLADKLEVFFSPTQAKLTRSDLNSEVEFYLGFSYDGLLADSYSVRFVGEAPKNKELQIAGVVAEEEVTVPGGNDGLPNVPEVIELPQKKPRQQIILGGRMNGIIVNLRELPKVSMGDILAEDGKRYFFHKNNERPEIFEKLKTKAKVTFQLKKTDKGLIAHNIEIA
ncbi:cold-shock protein [Chryseolinea soli]|uniref:Uncharacterized protein n=1 Tax=Chryseolinea soli TaxID=2321403 RepID=A0A385SQ18_9BACT|nr:hypothetical protein [Chryseolinea soli]AYB32347.1 hypothetical protein D4L85_17990 [Chryseolinea soli]